MEKFACIMEKFTYIMETFTCIMEKFCTYIMEKFYIYNGNIYIYISGNCFVIHAAQGLGKSFLSPFLQSVGSNFSDGANFASSGATAMPGSFISPMSLAIQVNQFKVFKQQVLQVASRKESGNVPFFSLRIQKWIGLGLLSRFMVYNFDSFRHGWEGLG